MTPRWRTFLGILLLLGGGPAWGQNQTLQGQKHGPWKVKYEGSSTLRYEGTFEQGVPVGTFTHYHPNGVKRAVMIFRGRTQVCYVREYAEIRSSQSQIPPSCRGSRRLRSLLLLFSR